MVRRISLAVVAAVIAIAIVNKDRLLARLRGTATSKVASATERATGKPGEPAAAGEPAAPKTQSLPELRKALKTSIHGERDEAPAPEPPADSDLEKVSYDAPLGKSVAYVTPVKPGAKRPAIVWIHGGFGWGIDESSWTPAERSNDQTAIAFRKAGIAEMYPALRGGSQSPGSPECFLGEVDDVLAAAEFLARRADVDPQRIYLGGHSTGGLMVLLAAESTPRFRTVFSFGPVADPRQYGQSSCIPKGSSESETRPRAPIEFLHEITTPTFIIEGEKGNAAVFPMMRKRIGKAPITFVTIPGVDHFAGLAPGYDVIAKAILADTGDKPAIQITAEAITAAMHP